MTLQDPAPFLFLCGALIVMSLGYRRRWRHHAFAMLCIAFLVMLFDRALPSLGILGAAVLVHYATVRWIMATNGELARRVTFGAWLVALLCGFAWAKQYWWVTDFVVRRDALPSTLATVGYSFLLFRQIHLAMQARDGFLREVRFTEYLGYTLAFWTFLAGPVQRYEHFVEQMRKGSNVPLENRAVLLGLNRAMIGFFKMFVVGALLTKKLGEAGVLVFPIHMYVNFSGYCDIMIGVAAAVGFTLPENFNHPYLARNSLEFWTRWHITLSEFFRDHLYFPLHTALSRRIPSMTALVIATLVSFTIMGMWHGSSPRFAVFGLLHALGVVAATLYQRALMKRLGRDGLKHYLNNRAIHFAAVIVFQAYVVLTFLPFQYEIADPAAFVRAVVAGGL